MFQKFKGNGKLANKICEFNMSKSTVVVKFAIINFFNDYPKLLLRKC